jgi:uncharacterized membrane protein (UPF0182 family)
MNRHADSSDEDDDNIIIPADWGGPSPRRGRLPRLPVAIALLALAGVAFVAGVDTYTDWLWYESVGYGTVFSTVLWTKVAAAVVAGLAAAAATYANLRLALRLAPAPFSERRVLTVEGRTVELPDPRRLVGALALPAAALVGLVFASAGWKAWEVFQLWRHQVPFGEADPVFGRDVAFYVFTLPALKWLEWALFALVAVNLAGAVAVYAARGAAYRPSGRTLPTFEPRPRRHLLALVAALFAALAWHAYLAAPQLLFSTDGPVAGATYTDLHARLPLLRVELAAAAVAAALAAASAFRRSGALAWAGVAVYLAAVVAGWVYPSTVQRFSVAPNELAKETPYIERNIAATRKAYGLDAVDVRELSGDATLTAESVEANRATIDNIRLWDQQPLLDTFAQIQEIRTYYDFESVDVDR